MSSLNENNVEIFGGHRSETESSPDTESETDTESEAETDIATGSRTVEGEPKKRKNFTYA
jgi:hypothetical protein